MARLISFILIFCGIALSSSAQVFFRITPSDGGRDSYIFGTHHLAPLSILDSIPDFQKYFSATDAVVAEIDMTGNLLEISAKAAKYMMAPKDSLLQDLFSPEEFARLDSINSVIMGNSTAPIKPSIQILNRMKPMAVLQQWAGQLASDQLKGFDLSQQIDSYFQRIGKEAGKEIIPLETVDYQFKLLFGESITSQADMLMEFCENIDNASIEVEALNDAYLHRNIPTLISLAEESTTSGNLDILLFQRNEEWLQKLPEILSNRPCFIAVGALHLYGPKGILEGLKNAGYKISAIY